MIDSIHQLIREICEEDYDGVQDNNFQGNTRLGVTFALPVTRHNSIKLYASTGASTRTGSNFDTVGIAWQYRWGGGF